ncbi:CD63 antigen [Taeniopygia guttata]|nr:CD63 antigen [Taeniopygia guttata]XP_041567560.1 CD63 antigen [Taeniopygia guttata]
MAVEGGMKCVKFLVFFFSFVFWLCGAALVAVGCSALLGPGRAPLVPGGGAGWSPAAVLGLGVLIFLTAFLGCCGAWRESHCMVTTFAVLLSLIFLVQLAAAVTGYVFRHKVHGLVEEGLWRALRSYEEDAALRATLDSFQQELSCCGVNNYTDWASVGSFGANDSVPSSCCRQPSAACNLHPTPATVFAKGCLPSLEAWVRRNLVVLAAVALGVAFFEVLGVVFSCCLMRGIRSGYEVM